MDTSLLLRSSVAVVLANLIGSVSWAVLVARVVRRIDMTEVGNGRIGTSLAIQRLGLGWGPVVAVLDFLKGAAVIALALGSGVPPQ